MSLKTFLHNIWAMISHLFIGLKAEAQKAIHIAAVVTDAIKNFDTANPEAADILTAIIPGTLDDTIKEKLRAELPKIVTELKLVDATRGLTDPNEIMLAATKVIQQLSGDYRSTFLNSLATLIAKVAADGKLDWNDCEYIIKWFYDHEYDASAAIAA